MRVALLVAAWLSLTCASLLALMEYKSRAGSVGELPAHWPEGTTLSLATDRPTLVLAAHPRCACTRATMTELARLISFVEARVAVNVLFVRPAGVTDEWMRTDTWDSAQEIPGAIVREDPEGADAKRFGAETSGQVVVYDPAGRLLFRGGITGSRGHEGDNLGLSRAIRSIRAGDESGESSVFGCALAENKMGEDR